VWIDNPHRPTPRNEKEKERSREAKISTFFSFLFSEVADKNLQLFRSKTLAKF